MAPRRFRGAAALVVGCLLVCCLERGFVSPTNATRRSLAAGFASGLAGVLGLESAQAYDLPDLPYAYDALEPSIDKATMEFHHDKHT